ncbi:hypothetical protein BOO24_19785 [Vibrio navarrensis]|uniref:GNAT family N-acetyltransferase n=1 Tax=Vibrio navarrensis TaxID=29495 RepID=UPI001869AA2E|nr:GNAT family N-acetyltransferase [Vibrio navarrensis]MBE4594577.1 hypothetical protein [Vibrio navarrensis]
MEFRRINPMDLDSFLALWHIVFNEGLYLKNPPPSRDRVYSVLRHIEALKYPNFVALSGGEVVGSVEAFPATMCGLESNEIGFVGAQVHPDFRQRGIGQQLLELVISDSKKFGYKELSLEVYKSNFPAIKLYEKFGFNSVGEGCEVTLPCGETTKSLKMSLTIVEV